MSITHMARVWELDLGPMETLVALALADHADEPGKCWPSIARLVRMTGMGERTVQRVLRTLEADGYLRRVDRPGNSSEFYLHLYDAKGCRSGTPVTAAPPSERHPAGEAPPSERRGRGAGAAPKPSENHHRDEEANASPSSAREKSKPKNDPFPRPDGIDPQVWSDFLANRRRKALANTATAHKRLMNDLTRFSDDEWPIPRLIEFATARGWGGIYDPRKEDHGRSSFNPEPTGVGPTERAALNIIKRRANA